MKQNSSGVVKQHGIRGLLVKFFLFLSTLVRAFSTLTRLVLQCITLTQIKVQPYQKIFTLAQAL